MQHVLHNSLGFYLLSTKNIPNFGFVIQLTNTYLDMKHQLFSLLLTGICLSSCVNSISEDSSESGQLCRLEVNIGQLVSQTPMGGSSTRAGLSLSDNTKSLTLFAVAEDGSVQASVTQSSSESEYGSVSMELPHGKYNLVAVAHNGAQAAYSEGVISFADGKVADTFIGNKEVTLSFGSVPESTTLSLQRRVAMLAVNMQDALPAGIKEAKMIMDGYSPKFDLSTSLGTAAETLERTFNLQGRDGQTNITVAVYTFVPSESHTTSLSYTVTNTEGVTLYTGTFPSLSLAECTQTKLYGNFFTTSNTWSVELTGDWKTAIEHNINN